MASVRPFTKLDVPESTPPQSNSIDGAGARAFITALVNGNSDLRRALEQGGVISLEKLECVMPKTGDYAPTDPRYALGAYQCGFSQKGTANFGRLSSAPAIYELLGTLHAENDSATTANFRRISELTCRVNPKYDLEAPERFHCEAKESTPASAGETSPVASFDCNKAVSEVEKVICSNPQIAKADYELGLLYRGLLRDSTGAEKRSLTGEQKEWIAQREGCHSPKWEGNSGGFQSCVQSQIEERTIGLNSRLSKKYFSASKLEIVKADSKNIDIINRLLDFSIRVPKGSTVSGTFQGGYHTDYQWRQFGGQGAGIAVVSINMPKLDKSNYLLEVRIGVRAGKDEEEACGTTKYLKEMKQNERDETLGEMKFQGYDLSQGGMSQFMATTGFQTFRRGRCYVIERVYAHPGIEPTGELFKGPPDDILAKSLVAAKTFRFLSP